MNKKVYLEGIEGIVDFREILRGKEKEKGKDDIYEIEISQRRFKKVNNVNKITKNYNNTYY